MRKIPIFICIISLILACLVACDEKKDPNENIETQGDRTDAVFGDPLESSGVYDGLFEEDESDVNVSLVSGTADAYTLENGILTFTSLDRDSVYSVSGRLKGCMVIDVGDEYKLELELCGFSLISDNINPITVNSADKFTLCAKKGYENYIYDQREAIDETDEALFSGAVHSTSDLEISGKGSLTVVSENNSGIHSKDDLEVKNLSLFVVCKDNALKGNDSVTVTGGELSLIAKSGDGIKTSNSDISEKGKQRGIVTIAGCTCSIYAACDGIDAAYDVIVDDASTVLNIYTEKYSSYSEEVSVVSGDEYFIRFTTDAYKYSVRYYNSDDDQVFVDAVYHSKVSGGYNDYYYYSFPKKSEYSLMQFFIYTSDMEQSQDENYAAASDLFTLNTEYDTIALSSRGYSLTFDWTNYTTSINEGMGGGRPGGGGGGFGGMDGGNTDKSEHSAKGIKASNIIEIRDGEINVSAYDDAIHANGGSELENGTSGVGNITVSGGNITITSSDDGIHADGTLCISGGNIKIEKSYEGLEGVQVNILGGYVSVTSSDDGINGTATSGTAITLYGGETYIYAGGDGIDSNSRTSYKGIVFSGGRCVIISDSAGNSSIDTEAGYAYNGGSIVAIMTGGGMTDGWGGGMTDEAIHTENFDSVGYSKQMSLSKGEYLKVEMNDVQLTLEMPCSISAFVVVLGDSSPTLSSNSNTDEELNQDGILWK